MEKEQILKLALKQENELTEQDKEYLKNLTEDDEDLIDCLVACNPYFLKYLKLKDKEIDVAEAIYIFVGFSDLYKKIKNLEELKKLNINSSVKFIYECFFSENEELMEVVKLYEKQLDERKIIEEQTKISNELIDYLNENTIYSLIVEKNDLPSITNDKNKINEYIEKGYPLIINYINPNLLSEELIEKALAKGYTIDDESPEILKTNPKYIRYVIEHGNTGAIDYVPERILEENEDLIYKAIDNGYYVNFNPDLFMPSPEILRTNPKYIKYVLEHGQSRIIDYISENILQENEDIIYLAIDKGYRIYSNNTNNVIDNIIKTTPKYIRYAVEHGNDEIIKYIPQRILEENIDLIYLIIDKSHTLDFLGETAKKLFLENEIKNQKSITNKIIYINFENTEISKLFDDIEIAYNYIKIIETKEKEKKEIILNSINGFSELGYQNLISSIIEFGDLIILKKIYEIDKYKGIIDKQKNRLMQIYPSNFSNNLNVSEFLDLMNEDIVDKINNEKLNSQIVKFIALNMEYYGSYNKKINEIINDKEFREIFATTLLSHKPYAIGFIIARTNDDLFKNKIIYYAIDLGYEIAEYSDEYLRQYKFIKYAIEKGKVNSLNLIEENTFSKEQIIELFIIARKNNYVFSSQSSNVLDCIIDNIKIMNEVLETSSKEEIFEILQYNKSLRKLPSEQLDIYIKKTIEKDYLIINEYLSIIVVERIAKNSELLKMVLAQPIEKISGLYSFCKFDLELKEKLSEEQLKCLKYYNRYPSMMHYFKHKTIEEIYKQYLEDESIWHLLFKDTEWEVLDIDKLDKKELFSIKMYKQINDKTLADEFKLYVINNYDNLDENKIEKMANIFNRLAITNSRSLFSIRQSLAQQLQLLDSPVESYNQIEKIFIRNNIPLYAKMYFCFRILYPNLKNQQGNMKFDDSSRMSPELKNSSLAHINIESFMQNPTNNDIRFLIIYNDLLRNAVKSNSKNLKDYLDNIELGNYLFLKQTGEDIINEKFDILTDEQKKEALEIFVSHLETLYYNTMKGQNDKTDLSNYDLIQKLQFLKEKFNTTTKYDLKDRIIRSFCYSAGFTSFEQIRNEMKKAVIDEKGRKLAQELEQHPFEFEDGDFLRCIGGYQSFGSSQDNGNFSKEFLTIFKETNDSDTTPLDIDFTRIVKKQSIYHSISGTPTGFGFGNIFLIIKKDNPNLNITRDEVGNLTNAQYDPMKLEMFGTTIEGTGGYETHWGVRTGMSLTDVDYILFKEDREINSNKPYNEDGSINYSGKEIPNDDLSKIKFEIARHGYYIPIIDFTGKLIFSVKEYEDLRKKMQGLSYYETNEFKFSDNLEIESIEEITPYLEQSEISTSEKRTKIDNILTQILSKHNLTLKRKIDGDLTPGSVEILDTGSTGRGTNKIGDGDFDLLLRIDQQLFRDTKKYEQFKEDILNHLKQYPYQSCGITDKGDYRLKGVQIDETTIVDIDISFTIKTDKLTYSTDECLKDRLRTIKNQDEKSYKKVVSNIILAKQILKEANCYKPSRSDKSQGGLGGAGIENWILQHGGSFIDAATSFIEASNGKTFKEFKKCYFIWDFGENHFAERNGDYPHDNFIYNMNETGYEKMKQCLKQYLLEYNQTNKMEQARTL